MDYLKRLLHIDVRKGIAVAKSRFPHYISYRYNLVNAVFDKVAVVLAYPCGEMESVYDVKNHLRVICEETGKRAVLVLPSVTARIRQGLIDAAIPFIVEGKQCYLPFMGIVLSERCDGTVCGVDKFMPTTQLFLFYYLLHDATELVCHEAAKKLNVSAMTVARAVRQLEQVGLVKTFKRGVSKVLVATAEKGKVFELAKPYLTNPIKSVEYVSRNVEIPNSVKSGDTALSHYSMLNASELTELAVGANDGVWKQKASETLVDKSKQTAVQLWKYDPSCLSADGYADVLSLAMCYADCTDERVCEAVDEMIGNYWRQHNG